MSATELVLSSVEALVHAVSQQAELFTKEITANAARKIQQNDRIQRECDEQIKNLEKAREMENETRQMLNSQLNKAHTEQQKLEASLAVHQRNRLNLQQRMESLQDELQKATSKQEKLLGEVTNERRSLQRLLGLEIGAINPTVHEYKFLLVDPEKPAQPFYVRSRKSHRQLKIGEIEPLLRADIADHEDLIKVWNQRLERGELNLYDCLIEIRKEFKRGLATKKTVRNVFTSLLEGTLL